MPTTKKLTKGYARIQFIANGERIRELSAQGYDISKIYRMLMDERRINMSYASFHDNFTCRRSRRLMAAERRRGLPLITPSVPDRPRSALSMEELRESLRWKSEAADLERAGRRRATEITLMESTVADVLGVDTDPMNKTFADFEDLGVVKLEIMDGDEIQGALFDELVEHAIKTPEQGRLVVGSGTSDLSGQFLAQPTAAGSSGTFVGGGARGL